MADISKIQIESGVYDIKDETARSDISTLGTTVSGLSDDITAVDTKYGNKFSKMLTFGDSWTGNVLNEDGTGTLANPSCNWADLLSKTLGLTLENYAVGGYAIYAVENNLRAEINRAVANITEAHRDDYKYIFIMIGVNDWQGSTDVGTIQSTLIGDFAYLKECFPHTQIVFIPLNYFAEELDQRARNIYSACLVASDRSNVALIPNFYNYLNTFGTLYYKDESAISQTHPYAHPNDGGHRLIKTLIAGSLNGKSYPFNFPLQFNNDLSTIYLSKSIITTDTQYLNLNCEITIKAGTAISASTWYDIGRIKYDTNNVYCRRYNGFTQLVLPYNDSFAELMKEYQCMIYLTNDGRLRLISKRAFTPVSNITLSIDATICRTF